VCEWVQLGATLRAITAAINIANTARQVARLVPVSIGTHSSRTFRRLSSILFYPRIQARMPNRYFRPPVRSSLRYRPIGREISGLKAAGSEFEMNSRPLSDCPIRED